MCDVPSPDLGDVSADRDGPVLLPRLCPEYRAGDVLSQGFGQLLYGSGARRQVLSAQASARFRRAGTERTREADRFRDGFRQPCTNVSTSDTARHTDSTAAGLVRGPGWALGHEPRLRQSDA